MREQNERRGCSDPVKGVAYFGLLGPPCGALFWTLLGFFSENPLVTVASLGLLNTAQTLVSVLLPLSLFSYFLGFFPAVLTGAVAGLLRERLHRYRYCMLIGLVGGITSGIVPLIIAMQHSARADGSTFAALMIATGFVSGSVVARLFAIRARKRMPLQR